MIYLKLAEYFTSESKRWLEAMARDPKPSGRHIKCIVHFLDNSDASFDVDVSIDTFYFYSICFMC